MEEFYHRDRGHNSHGCSQSRLGCFNGSLYIFSFTRSMGKKWSLEVLLIELRNQTVLIVFSIVLLELFQIKISLVSNFIGF